ncbi:MAG: DNA cytosine methyltransferase [Bacteroidota bacterium]
MSKPIRYVDLFAGAGGLSEGFIRAGYEPVAHVEYDEAACYTLKTRAAFHWLNKKGLLNIYNDYLYQKISRIELYKAVPSEVLNSIVHAEIKDETLPFIFDEIDKKLGKNKLDLIVGGPPCQAYSLVGRARDKNAMQGDSRNYLFKQYAKFLAKYQPAYFVFENVIGLLSAKNTDGERYFDKMKIAFKEVGYEIDHRVLSAKDFGVLQHRKRVIIIGKKGTETEFFPDIEVIAPSWKVKDAFMGLPRLSAGEGDLGAINMKKGKYSYLTHSRIINRDVPVTLHSARPHNRQDLEIYRIAADKWSKENERLNYNDLPERLKSHNNRSSFLDRFKVVCGDSHHSHTVVAHIQKDGHHYIHSDVDQNRSITPREAARLQSFPDDYYFESISGKPARTYAYRQIGNAVPVLMGESIAKVLKIFL